MPITDYLAAEEPEPQPTRDWSENLTPPLLTDRARLRAAIRRELDTDGWEVAA